MRNYLFYLSSTADSSGLDILHRDTSVYKWHLKTLADPKKNSCGRGCVFLPQLKLAVKKKFSSYSPRLFSSAA